MEKDIFQAAAKAYQKKNQPKTSSSPIPNISPFATVDNSEIHKMLDKMDAMKKDLEGKMDELYSKGRANQIDIDALFGGRLTLTKQQLQMVEEYERQMTKKIDDVLPAESCLKPVSKEKSKEQLTQERRSKMRGARKNWLPVR